MTRTYRGQFGTRDIEKFKEMFTPLSDLGEDVDIDFKLELCSEFDSDDAAVRAFTSLNSSEAIYCQVITYYDNDNRRRMTVYEDPNDLAEEYRDLANTN